MRMNLQLFSPLYSNTPTHSEGCGESFDSKGRSIQCPGLIVLLLVLSIITNANCPIEPKGKAA